MNLREVMQAFLDGRKLTSSGWNIVSDYVFLDTEGNLRDEEGNVTAITLSPVDQWSLFDSKIMKTYWRKPWVQETDEKGVPFLIASPWAQSKEEYEVVVENAGAVPVGEWESMQVEVEA